ncbi:rasGAP-activating-like protein 1 [Littorina saxatilis]|uniref:rasGAP-activating-like protein 1 n=1 Tax=Littorina saxatilis TaxID=31220 RepID=UPI0038B67DE9
MPSGFHNLSLYIYDADKVSGDDIIGTVSVTKAMMNDERNAKGLENWFPLQKANKDLEIQGEILLEYDIRTSEATGQSRLFVTVLEGRDLAPKDKTGYSDPYVSVTCFDETKTTSNVKKTRFPEWNETLEFLLPEDTTYNNLSVIVSVWDKDKLSSDDFMGQIHLSADDVTHGTVRKWHAVARRPHFDALSVRRGSRVERGKIRLKLQLLEETVLPSSCYEPIETLFLDAPNEQKNPELGSLLWDLLEQERMMELSHMAAALVRFYLAKDTVIEFLDRLVQRDVDRTDDPNTIFRGNTLGTKSVDQYMKILGVPYLQETLQPVVERIFNEKKTVELDPSRLNSVRRRHSLHRESEESFIHTSLEALEGYMEDVVDNIVHSVHSCPLALRIVLRNIYLKARLKWPHKTHEDTPYLAVSGFIFLRFFAPAILSPKLFSLFDLHPNRKINRTLTIMAKVTQSLGNLMVPKGCKEGWMEPLIPFMTSKISAIRNFLEELISVNVEDVSHRSLVRQQSNDTVLMQGRLYLCHYHCHRLFRPIVLKKCYFCLTRAMLSYSKSPDDSNEQTMVMVENICAVEPLDYGALGKSNMAQIIHKTPDDGTGIIYFQAKDVNSVQGWISAIRKTCKYNSCRIDSFHPGVFKGDKYNCCRRDQDWAPGCSQTYNGVVLGDWQDPLEPVVDAQIIYSQLRHSHDTLKKRQHELRKQLAQTEQSAAEGADDKNQQLSQQLRVVSRILDVVDQLDMSHETFKDA